LCGMTLALEIGGLHFDVVGSVVMLLLIGLWIAALVHAHGREKWTWLAVLIFCPAAAFVYGVVAAKEAFTHRGLRDPRRRREHRYQELRQEAAELERKVELQRKLAQLGSRSPHLDR